jgi:hypothetical protein
MDKGALSIRLLARSFNLSLLQSFFRYKSRIMKPYIVRLLLAVALFVIAPAAVTPVQAQCPMCRMSAESNLENGGTAGRGLNAGILYMLALPYVLVGAVGIWWWKNRNRE